MGRLFVVTGLAAAEPTMVGQSLAQALQKSICIDGRNIDAMVTAGRMPVGSPPTVGGLEQLYARYAGALTLAEVYRVNGFDAVVSETAIGEYLADLLDLADTGPLHLVVLHPSRDAVLEHRSSQALSAYGGNESVENQWNELEFNTRRSGLWIDTSTMTPAQIVVHILRNLRDATVAPVS
ncbi:hypothetical protein V3G39_06990 [Dermatophilaceae bacterium Sec6.4]